MKHVEAVAAANVAWRQAANAGESITQGDRDEIDMPNGMIAQRQWATTLQTTPLPDFSKHRWRGQTPEDEGRRRRSYKEVNNSYRRDGAKTRSWYTIIEGSSRYHHIMDARVYLGWMNPTLALVPYVSHTTPKCEKMSLMTPMGYKCMV